MKKYIAMAGYVTSLHDGQEHWITARRLAELYGVKLEECHLFERSDMDRPIPKGEYIVLRPLLSGKYHEAMELIKKRFKS